MASELGGSETVTTGMVCEAGVSRLNVEIFCGLRLSKSWKSSFLRFSTTLPFWSRTTTRSKTKFTRTLKEVAEARVTTSDAAGGVEGAAAGLGGGCGGCFGATGGA